MARGIQDTKAHAAIDQLAPEDLESQIAHESQQIHPIFAYEHWHNLSKADYLRILPALKMASIAITSAHALHFWHALMFGQHSWMEDLEGKQHGRFDRIYTDSTKPLPSAEEAKVRQNLDTAAEMISFIIEDSEKEFWASCEAKGKGFNSQRRARSRITINGRLYDILRKGKKLDIEARKRRWFELAIALVHEVAHAVHYATFGLQPEMFFGDDGFLEMGHALNNWLFEGEPQRMRWGTPRECLVMFRLPTVTSVNDYRAKDCAYPLSAPLPARVPYKVLNDDDIDASLRPY